MNVTDSTVDGGAELLAAAIPGHFLETILVQAAKIADERSLPRLLQLIQEMSRTLVLAEASSVWLVDREYDELYTIAADGVEEIRVEFGSGLVGYAIAYEESVLIADAYADARFNPEVDRRTGQRTRSVMVVPFRDNAGDVLGAFQVVNKVGEGESFSRGDLRLLGFVAGYAGKVLESVLLYQEVERTQSELLLKMGEVAESRSKDTGQHVRRVAEYSHVIALEAGFTLEEADLLKKVSPMHDVGKVSIPDSILNKPGKLSAEDFELMKSHTSVGYRIFQHSRGRVLTAAAIVAWQHHEKWNGTGYPRGLSGESIHPFARITAVADVFDALASERVYKRAWDVERIMRLFEEEKGKHFEPRLVEALQRCLPRILEIREHLQDPPMGD